MVDLKILVTILMLIHVVSVVFIIMVIRQQLILFKLPVIPQLAYFRKVLFILAIIILVGNIIPVIIDLLTLFVDTNRSLKLTVGSVGVIYSTSNALTDLVAAYLIWRLYNIAADTKSMTYITEKLLEKERNDK